MYLSVAIISVAGKKLSGLAIIRPLESIDTYGILTFSTTSYSVIMVLINPSSVSWTFRDKLVLKY